MLKANSTYSIICNVCEKDACDGDSKISREDAILYAESDGWFVDAQGHFALCSPDESLEGFKEFYSTLRATTGEEDDQVDRLKNLISWLMDSASTEEEMTWNW